MKNKKYYLYLTVGLVLFLFCFFYPFNMTLEDNPISLVAVDYLKKDMIIEKSFTAKYNDLNKLRIKFATYSKKDNEGLLNIKIIESESNIKLWEKDVNIQEIEDNNYYILDMPKQENMKNKTYKIILEVKNISEESLIGIYGYTTKNETMSINGKETNNNITITYDAKCPNHSLLFYPILYCVIIVLIEIFKKK